MTTDPNRRDDSAWGAPPTAPGPSRHRGPVAQPPDWGQPQAYGQPPGYEHHPHYGQQPHYGQHPHYGQQPQSVGYGGHAAYGGVAGAGATDRQNAEAQRQYYSKHEAAVRRVGAIFVFLGVALGSLAVWMFSLVPGVLERSPFDGLLAFAIGLMVSLLLIAARVAWVGVRLRRLDPWVHTMATRWSATLFCLGFVSSFLLAIPALYCWYTLKSDASDYVLSEPYTRIRALTPHVGTPTSATKVLPIVVGILLALVVLILLDVL